MTLEINLSLGQGWVKNFKRERNKLKTWHRAPSPPLTMATSFRAAATACTHAPLGPKFEASLSKVKLSIPLPLSGIIFNKYPT